MAWVLQGNTRVVSVQTAFTADQLVLACPPGYKIKVKGWSLQCTVAAAIMSPRFGSSGTAHLSSRASDLTTAGLPWVVDGVSHVGNAGQDLYLAGGAASAVVDGHFDIELIAA